MRAALRSLRRKWLLGLGCLLFAASACREETVRHRPAAGPPARAPQPEPDLREPARQVMSAALPLVERCELRDDPDACRPMPEPGRAGAGASAPFIRDECAPEPGQLAALGGAVKALGEAGERTQASGEMASFIVHAELFVDWLQLVRETGPASGTALHFQWLAAAYNRTTPAAPVPFDPPHLRAAYRDGPGSPSANEAKRRAPVWARRREGGTTLGWRRCVGGPCLPCW